jgi:hypothetical protein
MKFESMHEYYQKEGFLPTYGSLRSDEDLNRHALHRRRLFTNKLFLPPCAFHNAELIEFGPDSGENSLVFARWGANCTLVEPNSKAHPVILDYFRQFKLIDRLVHLECLDLSGFAASTAAVENYDVVDAEGFIYTVRPWSLWIDLFARLLREDGFVILFYYERFGGFMELLLKAIHACVRRRTGMSALESAEALFTAKWNSIPHKRAMRSWVLDVLENPFVRLDYFLEARSLCRRMREGGLHLYSSWPPYRDGLEVDWFKRVPSLADQQKAEEHFITRSRLSHLFGRKLFLVQPDDSLETELWGLLAAADVLIDVPHPDRLDECRRWLMRIAERVQSIGLVAAQQDIAETLAVIRSLDHVLRLLRDDRVSDLFAFCNSDTAFIRYWGVPSHFAVFRKEALPEDSPAVAIDT